MHVHSGPLVLLLAHRRQGYMVWPQHFAQSHGNAHAHICKQEQKGLMLPSVDEQSPGNISNLIFGDNIILIRLCQSIMNERGLFLYLWGPSCIGRQKVSVATWRGSISWQSGTG